VYRPKPERRRNSKTRTDHRGEKKTNVKEQKEDKAQNKKPAHAQNFIHQPAVAAKTQQKTEYGEVAR